MASFTTNVGLFVATLALHQVGRRQDAATADEEVRDERGGKGVPPNPCVYCGAEWDQPHHGGCEEAGRDEFVEQCESTQQEVEQLRDEVEAATNEEEFGECGSLEDVSWPG